MNNKDFEILDKIHFKSSVFVQPGTFFCVVRCFIEMAADSALSLYVLQIPDILIGFRETSDFVLIGICKHEL